LDAKNAFSQAFLDELIYIHYPEGFRRRWTCPSTYIKDYTVFDDRHYSGFNEISKALTKLRLSMQLVMLRCLFIKKDLIVFFYVGRYMCLIS